MSVRWLRAVLALPVTVLIVIPGILLFRSRKSWLFRPRPARLSSRRFTIAALLATIGLTLGISTARLFARHGEGTAAPWDPPQKFVVRGPYRFVRNPMMTGVFVMLFAEVAFLLSLPVLAWTILFIIGNAVYIPLIEERGLEKRFGNEYLEYKRNVPRWVPRLTPWKPY